MRSTTMPETRGRTSDTRVGAIRPGNSRTIARGCGLTVTMLTSGNDGCVPAAAAVGSSQPASNGDRAASITMTAADCVRSPDIWEKPQGLEERGLEQGLE